MQSPLATKLVEPDAADFFWQPSDDAGAACAIHRAAIAPAPAGLVRPDPLSHFENHTGRDGVILACMRGAGQMVGYGVLGIDSPTAVHLADLLGADAARFAILDGAAALPEWRGYGLHQAAIAERIACASARGRTLIGATVAPRNLRSLCSMFRAGFTVHAAGLMYGGLERLLLLRDTLNDAQPAAPVLRVDAGDFCAHQAALAAGLAGLDLRQEPGGAWRVGYG